MLVLISDPQIVDLKRHRQSGKSHNSVVMSIVENAKFDLRMAGNADTTIFSPLDLGKEFENIENADIPNAEALTTEEKQKKNAIVMLVSDTEIKGLKRYRISGKSYNTVVMLLMKNSKFDLRRLGDIDVSDFPALNLNKGFAAI